MRPARLGPVDQAATAFATVAVAAIVGWFGARESGWVDAWLPNVATSALSIAVTITIVDRIIRREAARKLRPRVERVLYSPDGFGWMIQSAR